MDKRLAAALADIRMLLRDHRPGTTADITDYSVLYLNGTELAGAYLSADEPGQLDEPFPVASVLEMIPDNVTDWLKDPIFTFRPSLLDWMKEAPPCESGLIQE